MAVAPNWVKAVTLSGFRQQMTYRKAMAMGALASVAYAVVRIVILDALYEGRGTVGGLTYEQALTWAVFAGVLFTIVWAPWVTEFPESIRHGTVVKDLLRPANPFALQLAHQGGRLLALVLVRVLPVVIVAAIVLPLPAPSGAANWIYFAVSLVAMVVASLAYMYMLGTTAFFTSDYHVWLALSFYLVQLIGGNYVPVEYFPGLLGDLVRWGPGMAFMASPTRIVNDVAPLQTLCIQLFWTAFFCGAAYVGLHLGRKKLVSFGG